jgi:hypothetical protein
MSDSPTGDQGARGLAEPPSGGGRPRRHILLTALMIIAGVILLLPGLCALFFIGVGGYADADAMFLTLWGICLLISAGGVWLLVRAAR